MSLAFILRSFLFCRELTIDARSFETTKSSVFTKCNCLYRIKGNKCTIIHSISFRNININNLYIDSYLKESYVSDVLGLKKESEGIFL